MDFRYHGRTVICSNPAIISTTGIIEAPAKPRGYYIELMTKISQGLNVESLKKKYQGTYLEYHDSRLNSITEGYILQALFSQHVKLNLNFLGRFWFIGLRSKNCAVASEYGVTSNSSS